MKIAMTVMVLSALTFRVEGGYTLLGHGDFGCAIGGGAPASGGAPHIGLSLGGGNSTINFEMGFTQFEPKSACQGSSGKITTREASFGIAFTPIEFKTLPIKNREFGTYFWPIRFGFAASGSVFQFFDSSLTWDSEKRTVEGSSIQIDVIARIPVAATGGEIKAADGKYYPMMLTSIEPRIGYRFSSLVEDDEFGTAQTLIPGELEWGGLRVSIGVLVVF